MGDSKKKSRHDAKKNAQAKTTPASAPASILNGSCAVAIGQEGKAREDKLGMVQGKEREDLADNFKEIDLGPPLQPTVDNDNDEEILGTSWHVVSKDDYPFLKK
jgi:hypothetical protein